MLLAVDFHLKARRLSAAQEDGKQIATSTPDKLSACLRPGDVLLVEGNSVFSTAIKYLTQSSWSHAALYVGDALPAPGEGEERPVLVEADINDGVRSVGLSRYTTYHTRTCRPIGLSQDDIGKIVQYIIERLGHKYDLRNIIDLARYLIPARFRRRLLALGSVDPTQAICSSLVAQAFQSIKYPILQEIVMQHSNDPVCMVC